MRNTLLLLGVFLLVGAGCAPREEVSPSEPGLESVAVPVEVQKQALKPMGLEESIQMLKDESMSEKQIRITTEKGDIVFEVFEDTAPLAVGNFVKLTNEGYYDGVTFHRREEGFVIQGGDPDGTGRGGPGYTFADELDDDYSYDRGIVAMANRGPNTNGSQFFIMLADNPLPKAYTIFGRVTEGMDVVDNIAIGDVMTKVQVEEKE